MHEQLRPPTADDPWEDLVVSVLAVNQYSLDKTYAFICGLRETGLVNPKNLGSWGLETIISRLKSAGCDRGSFMTTLFASRLSSLGVAVNSHGTATCTQILLSKDRDEISSLLLPISGIGPKVIHNFCLLRGIK
jgi:hypothetical protein